ncbi:uncharacterized protein LOC128393941 [Panonychus citri]|uniref:uncharacterized protein LOC128393941 n=1 Tax=Panonychus citri TaxID=50023 RepID=UPI002307B038|nr:uncharacterized protein LOC128393941 [Panonychus citri]
MNRFLVITFVVIISSCYGDAYWNGTTFGAWAKGMTPCELCKREFEADINDLRLARNQFLPLLAQRCGDYPTPAGSCISYVKVFESSFDLLIERQSRVEELCAYYGACESSLTLDISLPNIPAAPVTPKQNPPKVYVKAVCEQCKDITAAVTYSGAGSYANTFAALSENGCLSWAKTDAVPSEEDYKKCSDLNSVYFNSITDNMIDKTTQNYLCWDLFDVCEPSDKPSELELPYGQKLTN